MDLLIQDVVADDQLQPPRLGAAISESPVLGCSNVEKMRFHRLKAVFISARGNAPGMKCRKTSRPRSNAGGTWYAGIGRKVPITIVVSYKMCYDTKLSNYMFLTYFN